MNDIRILDCTLRDGGYCNQWNFGKDNIYKIIRNLIKANVDIIECGFLTNKIEYDENSTKYTHIKQLSKFVPSKTSDRMFTVMINYGEYNIDDIPDSKESPVLGIRVAFHKKNCKNALSFCKQLKEKGYFVFLQPMVSVNYSDKEFINLILQANDIKPYAFYIVDSFGTMKRKDLHRYFSLTEAFLGEDIVVGFHSHNNFQSALSNAESIIEFEHKRHKIIIDSTVYGMGRGAGNLNTELFVNYLNTELKTQYNVKPLLQIMDDILERFYISNPWGYTLPNYLSASYGIHPNYADYLSKKNTLTVEAMDEIFSLIDIEKAAEYDVDYIEDIYNQYMARGKTNTERLNELKKMFVGRKVLLIAPGKTASTESANICRFIKEENPIVISINHVYPVNDVDYVFVSNLRRFRELPKLINEKIIVTSNIQTECAYMTVDYFALINPSQSEKYNAGMMAIQFIMDVGCDDIWLAGYDGYSYDSDENYETLDLTLVMSKEQIDSLNRSMRQVLDYYKSCVNISFLTKSIYSIED